MMNIDAISARIKQRPPFQMIERVLELVPGESARGTKCVSVNEPYFMGHFPGSPIMPGVLQIECAAQLCSLVVENDGTDENTVYVLLKVDNFKFIKPVIPGDVLDITVTKTRAVGPLTSFDAVLRVDGEVRAKGNMSFTCVPRETIFGGDNNG